MKIIYLLIFSCLITYSQVIPDEDIVGYHFNNGQIILNPGRKLRNYYNENIDRINKQEFMHKINSRYVTDSNNSYVRYSVHDRYSTGDYCDLIGDGLYSFIGWGLNYQRVNCYNKLPFNLNGHSTIVSCSSSGEFVAVSDLDTYFYLLNGINGSLIWKYRPIPTSYYQAGMIAITASGDNIICSLTIRSVNVHDSSIVLCFNKNSANPVWQRGIPIDSSVSLYFQNVSGIRISGNDSLAIVSNSYKFFIIKVSTGEIIYWNWNNPYNHGSYGFQYSQGISGDGSVIAIANYYGYVIVYKWNGITYEYLWEDRELPGEYYNWITCVDVTDDGSMVAAGTHNFIDFQNHIYIGKVKFYRTYSGNNPVWIHTDSIEGVTNVSFSKNGKILCAATRGKYEDPSLPNLLVFKTSANVNIPIFAVSDSGSFYDCSASDDGTTVIGSGDKVHLNHWGMGGMYYNLYVDTSAEPVGIIANGKNVPEKFYLSQNYPNPFNPETSIKYSIPVQSHVKLIIFDILGREIGTLVNEKLTPGTYEVQWNGSNYSSGLYFYKLECDEFSDVKKMVLIK
jgi:hypothetical protein